MNRNLLITLIIAAAVVMTAGFLYHKYRIAPEINFKALDLTDLDGNPVNLQNYGNKKLFLNFFATWCGPCVTEMPSLQQAQAMLQNENFVFISISEEPAALLKRFRDGRQLKLHILHSSKKMKDLGIFTYPTNYILNAKGEVVDKSTGDKDWSTAESIEQLKRMDYYTH